MASRFEVLFSVIIEHEFFRDQNGQLRQDSSLFSIKPTQDCERILRDLGLLFRQTPNGFTVLFTALDPAQPQQSLLENLTSSKLRFYLTSNTPELLFFSDLSVQQDRDTLYYLSNRSDNTQSVNGNNDLLLTADTLLPYLSQDDLVTVSPAGFPVEFTSPNETAWLIITDNQGNNVFSQQLQKLVSAQAPSPHPFAAYVQLAGLEAGVYQLFFDNHFQYQFYLDNPNPGSFAVLEIFTDDSVPTAYQFVNSSGVVNSKEYVLRLNRRETIWKYIIGLKYRANQVESDLEVVSNQFAATFTRKASYTLADNTKAVPFESDPTLIPLLAQPLKGFSLKRKLGPGPNNVEETPLATPSFTNMKMANGKIYSEVYVYI